MGIEHWPWYRKCFNETTITQKQSLPVKSQLYCCIWLMKPLMFLGHFRVIVHMLVQGVLAEVGNLTEQISSCHDQALQAMHLCRRGALRRKVAIISMSKLVLLESFSLHADTSVSSHVTVS